MRKKSLSDAIKKFMEAGGRISMEPCDATLFDGSHCSRSARYTIDGLNLCTQHAGPIAIIKLLAANVAEKIDICSPYDKDPLCQLVTIYDRRK
jgi:hypothetical protein